MSGNLVIVYVWKSKRRWHLRLSRSLGIEIFQNREDMLEYIISCRITFSDIIIAYE